MKKILIVDDDEGVRTSLKRVLEQNNYVAACAADGFTALSLAEGEPFDLVILDIMMPRMNGYIVCEKLRETHPGIPVVFLSAKGDIVDKTTGFKSGADDYVTKPFDVEELLLRLEAILRRTEPSAAALSNDETITLGDLTIKPKEYVVLQSGSPVPLKAKEFEVLLCLARHPGQVFSRERIYQHVWDEECFGDVGVVAVYIRRIREQIEQDPKHPEHLITIWGVGYKLV